MEPTLTIAAAALAHARDDGLGGPVGRVEDRAERLVEVLVRLLLERRDAEDARAVDEHVDAAEALDGRRRQPLSVLAAAHGARHEQRALAGRVELGLGRREHLRPRAAEHDARALLEEALGGGLADASAAAGDDHDLVCELRCHVGLLEAHPDCRSDSMGGR
jgi:hypothetical protein